MGTFTDFFKGMSGTSEQKYGESLYDEKEFQKWKKKQDKLYGTLDDTKDRYDSQAGRFLNIYDESGKEADRYRGLAEGQIGKAGRTFDRATSSYGRAEADIGRARGYQGSANALMADREHYANLKRRAEERRRGFDSARLEMDSIRGRVGRPAQDSGMTQRLLDAFKGAQESNREIMEANTAQLARTNPVAAAKMQQQFNEDTLKSIGQLKQQGMVTDQQLSDNNLTREAGLLMDSTSLYSQQAGQDQMLANIQQQQISNYGNAGSAALNAAGAEGDLARGYLSQGGQYAGLGSQYAGMGSQLDNRGANALTAGMKYEGLGYGALQDQVSIANKGLERQDKFRLSDAAARARVDSFNNQRANMGVQNTLGLIDAGVKIYGAAATGGLSALPEIAEEVTQKPETPGQTPNNNMRYLGSGNNQRQMEIANTRVKAGRQVNLPRQAVKPIVRSVVNTNAVRPTSWKRYEDIPPEMYREPLYRDQSGWHLSQ